MPKKSTVLDIKLAVEKENGVPCSKQTLIFADMELADDMDLTYYNINRESTLHLLYPQAKVMQLKVAINRRFITLKVMSWNLVGFIKLLISRQENISRKMLLLFYENHQLEDNMTLADYYIRHEDIVFLKEMIYVNLWVRSQKETFFLNATNLDTIRFVKSEIQGKSGIAARNQQLLCGDKELEDNCTLEDCGIEGNALLHMALRNPN